MKRPVSSRRWPRPLARRRPRRPSSVRCASEKPRLLALEDRTLLSVFAVTSLADDGLGSLRQAIVGAEATPGDNTIVFAVTGALTLESALPDLNANMEIIGPGAQNLTLQRDSASGTPYFTLMKVDANASVAVSGLTLANGSGFYGGAIENDGMLTVKGCSLTDNAAWRGGGMINFGTLSVLATTISANTAGNNGGAIANFGPLTVAYSTLSGNSSSAGGALYNFYVGTAEISYSTLTFNHASFGGAIANNSGSVTLDSSTVAFNTADVGGGIANAYASTAQVINSTVVGNAAMYSDGGGIDNDAGAMLSVFYSTFSLNTAAATGGGIANAGAMAALNTIFAGNQAPFGADVAGDLGSLGHNLIANAEGATGYDPTDLLYADPQLLPLQDNGGPTLTMAPEGGSPILGAGDPSSAPDFDQRGPGYARVVNGAIDIGAYQTQVYQRPAPLPAMDVSQAGATATLSSVHLSAPSIVIGLGKVSPVRWASTPAGQLGAPQWLGPTHGVDHVPPKKLAHVATPSSALGLLDFDPLA